MNTDLVVQPIDVIRAAVDTLAAGLGGGEVFSPEHWDRSVATIARCHDQVGGDTRRQLYDVFVASAGPGGVDRVAAHLEALHELLATSGTLTALAIPDGPRCHGRSPFQRDVGT